VLLDTITYRISGHSPSDASSYRSKEEIQHWLAADSINAFRGKLLANGAPPKTRSRPAANPSKRRSSKCLSSPSTWRSARASAPARNWSAR